jgi:hypothetical protein
MFLYMLHGTGVGKITQVKSLHVGFIKIAPSFPIPVPTTRDLATCD